MAHQVTCVYCQEVFDRDIIPYVISAYRRYGHADCYTRQKELKKESRDLEIIDPSSIVECFYCKKHLNKQLDDCVTVRKTLVAHRACAEAENAREKTDDEKLENFICELFDVDYLVPRIKKQITQYKKQFNYSARGIAQALSYFYRVKGNSSKQFNDGIGIVPYVYNEAHRYYYDLWLAQQANENKVIEQFIPQVIEVTIPTPRKENKMKKLFSFLDKDEIDVQ